MATKVKNAPSPDVLMNSMRSIGYTFESAIADIIDNSISAKANNIYIDFPVSSKEEFFITILDDGLGMGYKELLNAMKYGSSKDNYDEQDLGRFGLGLKSASLSQCKILTVVSKKDDQIYALRWNLDEVLKDKEWNCLSLNIDEINCMPNIDSIKKLNEGTMVVWENFDIAFKQSKGQVFDFMSNEIDDAEDHIRLVFHRFLNRKVKKINIFINERKLVGFDPFLENSNNPKIDLRKPSLIEFYNSNGEKAIIKMQACILPHQNDLTVEEIESLGVKNSIKESQGFYVYRNERLIIYGTWFGLSTRGIDPELFKYGRIKVDIPNTLDDIFEVDIKKQNAKLPKDLITLFKKTVMETCLNSKRKNDKRTRITYDENEDSFWAKSKSRDNKDYFYINQKSRFISNYIEMFDDKYKSKIIRLLDIISATIPYDDIYNSVCNKRNIQTISDENIDSMLSSALEQIDFLANKFKFPLEDAAKVVTACEPFNKDPILSLIMEKIKGKGNYE